MLSEYQCKFDDFFEKLSKDRPSSESRQNVDFYVRPAFRVLVLPIKGFTAYYTAFNSSFSVSFETAFMDSPLKQNLRGWVGGNKIYDISGNSTGGKTKCQIQQDVLTILHPFSYQLWEGVGARSKYWWALSPLLHPRSFSLISFHGFIHSRISLWCIIQLRLFSSLCHHGTILVSG